MHTPTLPARALLALLLALPPLLPAASVEERLQELETKLQSLSLENDALRQKFGVDADKPSPLSVTVAGKEKSLSIGGYLQLQAETGDAPDSRFPVNDRFLVRRARVTLKGSFVENFGFVFQSEFGSGSLGTNANYRAQLTDLYVVWDKLDYANITFGQFKTPYGYEQLQADTRGLLIERSLPNDRLTLSRQIGAMVSGDVLDERLSYSVAMFNGNGVNQGTNDNNHFAYVGRVSGKVLEREKLKVSVGANAFQSSDDTAALAGERSGLGLDLQASSGRFDFAGEWLQIKSSPDAAADTTARGWSALAGYYLVPKKFQAVARYEIHDPNTGLSDNESDLWTVGFNHYIKGNDLKLSLNYLLGDPAGPLADQGRLIARMQVIF